MNVRSPMTLAKALLLAFALSASACAQTYMVKGLPSAPDADGKITAKVILENKLTQISIKAEHLAPPERLLPGATTYVVWGRKDGKGDWLRIAKLDYDPDSRKGTVEIATVPLTGFELGISAEQEEAPKSPSPNFVFQQKISN